MAGLLTDIAVAARLATRATSRRLKGDVETAPSLDDFSATLQKLIDSTASGIVRDYSWITLSATQPPWVATDLCLEPGDELSYFIEGRVYANRFLDIQLNNALQIWSKVGDDGDIFRGTRCSHSFRASNAGNLQFGNYFPNDWADTRGSRKQSDEVYAQLSGEVRILVVRWNTTTVKGLRSIVEHGDYKGYLRGEIERIEQGDITPAGWQYLWNLGPAEIYRDRHTAEGKPCIHCHTDSDVGILQHNVDLALESTTEISWRWCIDRLPSDIREDSVPSHDYLSLAVEFDNGRDITYYWSSKLPVATGYDCPLPNWRGIEFHVVVRSGAVGLGEWHQQQRNLYQDYQHYMGQPPARIVKIWLIANSVFQRKSGTCDYADILLHDDKSTVRLL